LIAFAGLASLPLVSVVFGQANRPGALDPILERNKDVIERFFDASGKGDVATLRTLLDDDYIEHADAPDGREAFLKIAATNPTTPATGALADEVPRVRGEIIRMLAQRDEVWVYNRVVGADGRQVAGMDMFRLAAGRVTEHWAIAEQVPSARKNDNDNYAVGKGPGFDFRLQPKRVTKVVSPEQLEANKALVIRGLHADTLREDYIQHNADIETGRAAFLALAAQLTAPGGLLAHTPGREPAPGEIAPRRFLAEGDFVWTYYQQGVLKRKQLNQFRIEGGLIAEQWGLYQPVPEVRLNNNDPWRYGRP
jgi:predicted SnoaL-like aldol condensation-catalyzing enzyme